MDTIKNWIKITIAAQDRDWDCVWCIVGGERRGKSSLALHIYEEFCKQKGIKPKICFFSVDIADFIKSLDLADKGGMCVLDEAGDSITSANYYDEFIKKIREAYTIIGAKNLFTIIILPDFFLLDTYFRKWRVKTLLNVYRRGKVSLYCGNDINRLNDECQQSKNISLVKPTTYDDFPKYEGDLLKEYLAMKNQKVRTKIKQLQEELNFGDSMSLKKAAKFLNISYPTALRWVIDKKIPALKTGANRFKVKIIDLEKVEEELRVKNAL